ncbi:glycosyl transferase family 2 [Gloeothece citriformis PCC 7424]|uniref:Beta-monoglucosyldiacylglycerol synthase n=1 Tax=Gloeothece citriformis (strain PCC 7424) TaxID=65393 RepID=B7K920_GLOC7|nr:glycosyltransferase family 2 protein [Gloeothece citriformis]ACK72789.1 glycosyl transferase family 2 [Gloeothece citriformis PCC 7424]
MPQNYWTDNDPDQDFDPISSLLSEWTDPEDEEEEFRSDFFQGLSGRRRKAALMLMMIWGVTIGLHLVTWGTWVVMAITGMIVIHALRLITATPEPTPEPLSDEALKDAPFISLLVAAKNEEAVISNLVNLLCNLNYPTNKYEVWIIDDYSTDKTPQILDNLAKQYSQLNVVHRPANAGGGKSGALNEVLPLTQGEIIGVFDADARISPDLLRSVVPLFENPEMGAVQVRKAIANASENFWTKGQMAEMALDSYFQQKRIAIGGIGELRGNGQFVRRTALERCGKWNEQTITDDLDLTIRLHLDNWKIGFLVDPDVEEEGVTNAIALWHQRNRWAEGGYQRYLDYWRLILSPRMGLKKKVDMITFIMIQYLLPSAAIPDFVMMLTRDRLPIFSPASSIVISLSCWGMYSGLKRIRKGEALSFTDLLAVGWQTLRGTLYMMHWFIIIPSVTARMSIRPKRLKWVKTVHQGTGEESFEF